MFEMRTIACNAEFMHISGKYNFPGGHRGSRWRYLSSLFAIRVSTFILLLYFSSISQYVSSSSSSCSASLSPTFSSFSSSSTLSHFLSYYLALVISRCSPSTPRVRPSTLAHFNIQTIYAIISQQP